MHEHELLVSEILVLDLWRINESVKGAGAIVTVDQQGVDAEAEWNWVGETVFEGQVVHLSGFTARLP